MDKTKDVKMDEIQILGKNKLSEFLGISKNDLGKLDRDQLTFIYRQAHIAAQIEKLVLSAKNHEERSYISIGKMISESKEEMKAFIKRNLGKYI